MAFQHLIRACTALSLVAVLGSAGAQTSAAPAGDGKTLSLGGGNSTGKLLSMEELRTCMKQREALAAGATDLERERAAVDAERAQLDRDRDALTAGRAEVTTKNAALSAFADRQRELKKKSDDWQQRMDEFKGSTRNMGSDRQQRTLERENAALVKESAALEAERVTLLSQAEQAVANFNARAKEVDGRIALWNQRSTKLSDTSLTLTEQRQNWGIDCGNRRYREDDEKAILRGQ